MERTGWTCVYANDIDPKKRDVYVANFPGNHFQLEDIWNLDPVKLPHPLELITASFPCVDLSLAGNRSGLAGKHSGTFWALIRILTSLIKAGNQPPIVLVENVVGFLTSHDGSDFVSAVKALNDCGYVVDAFILDAKHFTPQSRPRLFLLGFTEKVANKLLTQPNEAGILSHWNVLLDEASILRPSAIRKFVKKHDELRWGLLNIPEPPQKKQNLADIIEHIQEDSERWWNPPQVAKLLGQMPPKHLFVLRSRENDKEPYYGTVYRRKRPGGTRAEVRTDGLAGCLRTPRGGSSKQIIVRAWGGEIRARWMTPREYARLQGVPDTFKLPEKDLDAYFGFGDAVCVPAVQWIAKVVLNPALKYCQPRN